MCESTAFLINGEDEELFLNDVVRIVPKDDGTLLVESLLGEQKEINGSIDEIDFMSHKILLRENT
jgi:predicted RNA-binding protein